MSSGVLYAAARPENQARSSYPSAPWEDTPRDDSGSGHDRMSRRDRWSLRGWRLLVPSAHQDSYSKPASQRIVNPSSIGLRERAYGFHNQAFMNCEDATLYGRGYVQPGVFPLTQNEFACEKTVGLAGQRDDEEILRSMWR